ncbi:MAG: ATP-dependent helicase [Draconibacterium sp.]|nr:ATP-dependent helicase [Draconibacterium sp.]
MAETEFIIALTEHRSLGNIYIPYLIQREDQFYKVLRHVKPRDFKTETDYEFKPYEKELVEIIEKYSDERLVKKFSRATNVKEFYLTLEPVNFKKNIAPFIEQCMFKVASILMLCPVRLLNKDMKYANLYDEDEIRVQSIFARPVFYFERTENETRYNLKIFQENKEIKLLNSNIKVVANEPCQFVRNNKLYVFERLNGKKLAPFFEKEMVTIPNSMEEKYYGGFILNAVRDFEVHAKGFTILEKDASKSAVLSIERNLQLAPCLVLIFYYGNEKFLPNSLRKQAVQFRREDNAYVFRKVKRDFEWENEIQDYLKETGLSDKNGYYTLPSLDILENENALYFLVNWINKHKQQLDAKQIQIVQEKLNKRYYTGLQHIDLQTKETGDWFDIHISVSFGEFSIPFVKLKKFILNDIREFELPNGEIAVLPEEWFARYKGLIPFAKITGDKLQFEKYHFLLLQNALKGTIESVNGRLKKLEYLEKKDTPIPTGLKAELRSYQSEGYSWMLQLYENGFGGCLADDMGLGKTLQTLALLLKLKKPKGSAINHSLSKGLQLDLFAQAALQEKNQPASLIVLPTSLVHNWDNEISKFTPSLKVYKYVGIQRKKSVDLDKIIPFYDIVLTTYGTVRNDINVLRNTAFFYVILDESQYVKNPASKTYKAILQLKSKHRLVLTGTPIENSLSDLWSQMNFLNPGLLGNQKFFQKSFIVPIEKSADEKRQEQLQLIIKPFILRRKKDEVAKDLPPLTEQVIFCTMADNQEKLYEKEKSVIRNAILENIEKEGLNKSAIIVLQGLTKLRQLANHPSLLVNDSEESSGKFDQIQEMLDNLVAEKHKVLIFSSFVSHLKLVQKYIEEKNWKFSMLTGQTVKREEVIKEFQDDAENHIFLISLKAGGVGLNLTKAGYVFIIDPWWNPAAENQAVSRAHRIGQDKQVFVYRFITENSIEEKIQLLKERKTSLSDKFINSNNPFKEITKTEIMELFD